MVALIAGLGVYFFFSNKDFNKFIKKNIIGDKKETVLSKEYEIYCIADGTYSVNTDYAIPQINKEFIERIIDSIHYNGSGKFWITYIDKDSKNNRNIYIAIPPLARTETYPKEINGESSFDYEDRIVKWKENISKYSIDSIAKETTYYQRKSEFIKKCDSLLKTTVYVKSSENRFSDVIGTLNSIFKSLGKSSEVNVQKFVIAFSDLQQDTPNLKQIPELEPVPEKVTLIATNPSPGSSNACTDEVEELDSPERVFETIFK